MQGQQYYLGFGYLKIEKGQAWVGVSSGGGGFGSPLERDPALVVEHVRDGIISGDTAKNIYGVIFNEETLTLDAAATVKNREALKKKQGELPLIQPMGPSASKWLENDMREGDNYLLDPLP